ncbi:leucine-rich repeat flightless-interacting protein 2-like isoform 2-T2 [Menidia menidia]
MKELEKNQKELFHSHKKLSGLDTKWGHIEQWMEDSERYSRLSRRHASVSDDEERLSVGSRGSLRPSDYSSFLGSGSRASSRASSARASPVVEERMDKAFLEQGSRTASTLSAATLASLGGASSRRGSCDTSFSVETEASIREIKDSLAELEEKYRRAMVSNAQLHNDKAALMFQVEALREGLGDTEEQLWEARRHGQDAQKEAERERQARGALQEQVSEMKDALRGNQDLQTELADLRQRSSRSLQEVSDLQEALQWKDKRIGALERQRETSHVVRMDRDRLRDQVVRLREALKKHAVSEISTNGDAEPGTAQEGEEPASPLADEWPCDDSLELRFEKLLEEREDLRDQVKQLQTQLDQGGRVQTQMDQIRTQPDQGVWKDPVQKPEGGLENGMDPQLLELQRDSSRQLSDLRFRLVRAEQEVASLEQKVLRLEAQVSRYRSASESSERLEDELKVEKRRLQRELRWALDRLEELEASNGRLTRRLDRLRGGGQGQARPALRGGPPQRTQSCTSKDLSIKTADSLRLPESPPPVMTSSSALTCL